MIRAARILAATLTAAVLAAACGGTPTASAPAPTATAAATATVAAATATSAATVAATPSASPAPAYAGVGSTSTKLSENTTTVKTAPVHIGFIGDEPSLTPGAYTETLNLVTLQPGGRTVSHKHGGLEVVIVLEGNVEINMGAAGKAVLAAGQTAKVPAGTPIQATNSGAAIAKFLAFFMTPEGQPFQTNLTTVP